MADKALLTLKFLAPQLLLFSGGLSDVTFPCAKHCPYTVWRGSSPHMGDLDPEVPPDSYTIFYMDDKWSGIIWARTKCSNNTSSYFSCETGDCGLGVLACAGSPPPYPVTLLDFNINQSVVSCTLNMVHGQNIKVHVLPNGGMLVDGSGPCPVVDCTRDFGDVRPPELIATNGAGWYVGFYGACDALKEPKMLLHWGWMPAR